VKSNLYDLKPGTYLAKEVSSDDAHIVTTTPQQIYLEAGQTATQELIFFNDLKPGMWLVKVDSADLSKPIANAKFEIKAVDGSFGPKEFTTDQNGEIDLSKLDPKAYVVTELSCPGYVIDDAQRIIELKPNETAQFVFTNSKLPELLLKKISSDGSPLEGVSFRLAKIADGSRYLDRTTNGRGEILWEGLEPGVYSLLETATVDDHIIDRKEYHVELFPGKTSTITMENNKRPNLYVMKNDADTGEPVPHTVFTVRAADGHSVDEIETDGTGRAELKNVLPGVYEISEKSVPAPYLPDAPSQLVTLYPNRDHTVYFKNHKRPIIEIIKENAVTFEPLANVPFQVWYASNNTSTGEFNDLGTFYTDENGRIVLNGQEMGEHGLKDGWFRVKELEPLKGFAKADPDTQEAFVAAGQGHTFRFRNQPLSAICVWKYDRQHPNQAIEGAVFQVKYLSGNTSGTGGTVIGTYRTSANGSFTVTGLKKGTYVIEELSSDGDHVVDTPPQTVYLSGQEQEVIQVYFGNSAKGALLVKKVDAGSGAPLSDVEFLVTKSDGSVVGDANGKFVTDSAGTFTVNGIEPGTTLIVKETRAKPGYLLDNTPQTVQVKAGQTVTLEFRNQKQGNLIIHKLSGADKKTPLEGVQFKITYADGRVVDAEGGKLSSNGLYTTNKEGQIILSGITGTIICTEVASIPGFTIDPGTRSQTIVVNPGDDTQHLYFYNDPVGGVEIIKVREDDRSVRIPNVTFEIRRMDGGLVDTVTTGKDGRVFVTLEAGSFYAVETDCPKEYKLDATPHYFTVRDGKSATLTIKNKAFAGILIRKTDSVTGKGIYGVTFLLYDSTNKPIGQYTSDDRGYVYIEGLTEGGRFYLRELENEGYVPDNQMKTVYVKAGETTLVEWKNTPITGQIQITKKSADYNSTNGLPAGTLLEGAVFEIRDKAGNLVDTIRSDSRGVATSKPLPLSRYTIREVKAPANYRVSDQELTAYLEHAGQIVRFEVTNKALSTGVSITKTGPKQIMAGQPVRYVFSDIANRSNVMLTSFYWRDTLPAEVRLDTIVTGTYNFPGTYKITYRVNGGEPRTLADNLSTGKNYTLAASSTALGLASNERVTEVMFVFGQAPGGFAQVEKPMLYCTAVKSIASTSFVNVADVGGVHNGIWVQAVSRWVTSVYGKPIVPSLPKTGY